MEFAIFCIWEIGIGLNCGQGFPKSRISLVTRYPGESYLPMQKVEKMRFRMSSAVVLPVMASSGWSAP